MTKQEKSQIAESIHDLAEAIRELSEKFQTDVGYYKNIADIFEEMNYHQNKEKIKLEKLEWEEKIKQIPKTNKPSK